MHRATVPGRPCRQGEMGATISIGMWAVAFGAPNMRVLHVLPFPGIGGTEIATRRIAEGLRPFGVESRALLLAPSDVQVSYLHDAGIACVVPQSKPEPSFRNGGRFLLDSWQLARTYKEFDIVHCADVSAAYYAAVAGRLAKIPVVSHVRNRYADLPRRSRFFVNAATHFIFVSKSTRDQFALRVSDSRASVVYDGIAGASDEEIATRGSVVHAVRCELGLPPDAIIAAMFARVNPQKDYRTLARAAALLRNSHPRLRFVIVGDHSEIAMNRSHYQEVRQMIAAAGVSDRFLFTGFRSDIRRIMLASDVCVLSTHFEGLPLVLIEAMSLGRPCVATAVDGVLETVDDGVTGLVHRHGDPAGLASCLVRFLDDPAFADRLGNAARAEACRRFGPERFAHDMFDVYAHVTGHGGGPRRTAEDTVQVRGEAAGRSSDA